MIAVKYAFAEPYRAIVFGEPARPFLDVCLEHRGERIFTIGLVDSGAETALFNAQYAQLLGLDLESGRRSVSYGMGDPITVWSHEVILTVRGKRFLTAIDFSHEWLVEYGLLGLNDLFAAFLIGFDHQASRFFLAPA